MDINIKELTPLLISIFNAIIAAYVLLYRNKREGRKLEVDSESELIERTLKSAGLSNQMLIERIDELKNDLEEEREARRLELEQERADRDAAIATEREARKKEVERLRTKLNDSERENRDLRKWSAQLVKQIVEDAKLVPVPFIPSPPDDSDPNIIPIKDKK